ncbi:MAG TPA: nuclear transport factor 2 family protein [Solirubrobacterales bacterium]|nr:nuclear transport factor 2 family protein [Solirubrobacterales bacterium]
MTDVEQFMQRYLEVWPTFDADRLEATTDPELTVHHSGMERPISGAEEADYVRATKALMPDISLEVANWAANGDVVFIEYEISATLAGRPLSWTGIGRFKLCGSQAIDAIGRWDNLALLSQIDPRVSATAFAETAARLVAEVGSAN